MLQQHLKLFVSKVLCPRFEEIPSRRFWEITLMRFGPLTTSRRSWETPGHKTGTRMDKTTTSWWEFHFKSSICTHPGIPPDSSLLAMSTSQDQTSNCHFLSPNTPHSTEPEWIPIRISMSCFVRDRTYLEETQGVEFSGLPDRSHHMLNRRMKTKAAGKIMKIYVLHFWFCALELKGGNLL